MKNRKLLGNVLLLLTAMIWGTALVFQRAGMALVGPFTFNAVRIALAAVSVGLVALFQWRREKASPPARTEEEQRAYNRNTLAGGIFCGFFLCVACTVQQVGLVYTTAGKAGFITAMYILLVPVIGFILFRRKNTWLVRVAVLLGMAGLYFLCMTEELRFSQGDALVCVSALFYSFHILCCGHFVPRGNPIRISAIQFAVAAVLSAAAAVITEDTGIEKVLSALVPILYCGVISGGIGYTLQIIGQKYTDPTTASLLMSTEAVFAASIGAVFLHERMSVRELFGCALMFAAVVLVQIPVPEKARQENPGGET